MDSNAVFKVKKSTSSIQCFAFIAMLFWGSILSGQTLSDDPDQFVPEFTKLLNDMKTDAAKAVSARFESLYIEGSLTPQMVAGFAEQVNSMISRRMGLGTYILPMTAALNGAAGYGTSLQRYTEWLDIIDQMLMDSKSPNNSSLKKWLLFSDKFFNNNYLYSSQSRVWEVEAEDYRFVMDGKKPEVFFPLLELVGSTTGDTIRILRARGTYKPLEYVWLGTQGRIDWQRANFDPSNVYADFRAHKISFKESDFQIDSAELTYAPVLTEKLIGSFKDKLVQNNNPSKTSYPKFRSYNNSTTNIELYPNVKYIGQFALEGYQFKGFGVKGNRAVLEFYNDKGELAVRAKTSDSFVDDRDRIHSSGAEVVIYFGEDSLYHPNIKLQFDQGYSDLTLTREDKGATSAPFFSSYHKLEYNPIQLVWNLEDTALYMRPKERVGRKTADFSSVNLYDDPLYYMVQGPVSYHPLVAIKRYADATQRTVFGTLEIAQQFNRSLSIDGAQSLLYELMRLGFIYYDKANEEVHMLDKTDNYVLANAERIDFDVIKMLSEPEDKTPNAVLNLGTGALKINGVFEINLSDSQFVKAFPSGKTLTVNKNRDMKFGGTLFGGSSDFYGEDFEFHYDSFSVKMSMIDSMVMYSASEELDGNGQAKLMPIQTAISGLSGTLYIDNPDNKSGREKYEEYPIFKSSSPAFASYDKSGVHNNAYDEERFFFEVDEFRLDSLDSFDPANIGFSGTLKSDGIFPDIDELLTVQEDNSMGFQTQTPAEGLPLYDGVGRFTGDIGMSNDGLTGAGKINYVTTELIGDRSYFFPDSAQGIIDSVMVRKQEGSTPFPEVSNKQVNMDWKPKADSLTLKMGTLPFVFFGGLTELEGSVTITPKELRGEGIMDWEEARATASDFSFGAMSMEADSAKFVIKSPIENRFALVLNNAYTNMDFENRKGVFRSNNRLEPTELPFNRYQTNINVFEWDIDGKSISFLTTGEEYSSFRSLSKRQDSLRFLAKNGIYNMEDHVLQLEGVPYIAVGDAYIYPFEGKVVIEEDAIMQTLVNARIEFDSLTAFHEIKNAEIQIQGKYKMRGEGDYVYINRLGEEQNIHFEDISTRQIKSEFGDTIYETFAQGVIPDSQLFYLDPKVLFKGPVSVSSTNESVDFNGFAKMNVTDTSFSTGWFAISDAIESDNFLINIDTAISENKDTAYVGIYRLYGGTELYPLILDHKRRKKDKEVMRIGGFVQFREETDEFIFGDQDRADEFGFRGSLMRFADKVGEINADGPLDLMTDFGNCRYRAAGSTRFTSKDTIWTFNSLISLKLLLTEELLEKFSLDFYELNLDAEYVDYIEGSNLIKNLPQIMSPKQEEETMQDVELMGEFRRPKGWDYDITIADLKLQWNENTESWRNSVFTASILHIGEQTVNQQAKVVAEFAPRASGDYFNIYLETDLEDWYYFTYRKGVFKIISSMAEYNDMVLDVDPKKATFKNDSDDGFSVMSIGSIQEKNRFLSKMGYFGDSDSGQ